MTGSLIVRTSGVGMLLKELLSTAPREDTGGIDLDELSKRMGDGTNLTATSPGIMVPVRWILYTVYAWILGLLQL